MAVAKKELPYRDVAEFCAALGDVAPSRILLKPLPGQATERDLRQMTRRDGKLYELVEGTIVEKEMNYESSTVAAELLRQLGNFVVEHDLGNFSGADGGHRLLPGLIRLPDAAFVSKARWTAHTERVGGVPDFAPELVVEVLSPSNRPGEVRRKLKEYFLAGTLLGWVINPVERSAVVYTAPDRKERVPESGCLDGGAVLPGLRITLKSLFTRLAPTGKGRRKF